MESFANMQRKLEAKVGKEHFVYHKAFLAFMICLMFVSLYAVYAKINDVRMLWLDDRLRVVSIRNGIVVTHLVGFSQGELVVAALPEPLVEFDSGGPTFDYAYLTRLRWLDRRQKQWPPPAIGSRMSALYYRPKVSQSTEN